MSQDDFEHLRNQIIIERATKALKETTGFHDEILAPLGFDFVDDNSEAGEVEEELAASPKNALEKSLMDYFEGQSQISQKEVQNFITLKNSKEPNYPLIRRYFKQGNEQLLKLLLYGLSKQPTNIELLQDLHYFHQHRNIHFDIVRCYLHACEEQQDIEAFIELVEDFIHATQDTNFDALHQLKHAFPKNTLKGHQIRKLKEDEQLYFEENSGKN